MYCGQMSCDTVVLIQTVVCVFNDISVCMPMHTIYSYYMCVCMCVGMPLIALHLTMHFSSPFLSLPPSLTDLSLSLAHAVHDHVKRDYIFCLSTANGNTYYLQVM